MKNQVQQHPTGLLTLAASAVILVAARFHVEISAEEASVFIGLVAGVASYFTPRVTVAEPVEE